MKTFEITENEKKCLINLIKDLILIEYPYFKIKGSMVIFDKDKPNSTIHILSSLAFKSARVKVSIFELAFDIFPKLLSLKQIGNTDFANIFRLLVLSVYEEQPNYIFAVLQNENDKIRQYRQRPVTEYLKQSRKMVSLLQEIGNNEDIISKLTNGMVPTVNKIKKILGEISSKK